MNDAHRVGASRITKQNTPILHPFFRIHASPIFSPVSNTGDVLSAVSTAFHIRLSVSAARYIRLSVSTARHIRSAVSITHHFRWSLKMPDFSLKMSKCRRAPRPAAVGWPRVRDTLVDGCGLKLLRASVDPSVWHGTKRILQSYFHERCVVSGPQNTHEVICLNFRCAVLGHDENNKRMLEAHVQASVRFRHDACRDRRSWGQDDGCANQFCQ